MLACLLCLLFMLFLVARQHGAPALSVGHRPQASVISHGFAPMAKRATSPFVDAARQGRLADLQAALEAGEDVNSRCPSNGSTALIAASKKGRSDLVELLVAHNADINLVNDLGNTAFDDATEAGHPSLVLLLRALGGRPNPAKRGLSTWAWLQRTGAWAATWVRLAAFCCAHADFFARTSVKLVACGFRCYTRGALHP